MATFTTNLTVAQASVASRFDGKLLTGREWIATATYTCTGTEVAGDLINICVLPVGAIVMTPRSRVSSEACGGTTGTIATLGDAITAARYSATAVGITAAATGTFTGVIANEVAKYATADATATTAATTTIIGVIGLASGSFTAGKKVVFEIVYLQ